MVDLTLPAASGLRWRDRALYMEDVCVEELAQHYGTPLFVYSQAAMLDALAAYRRGFAQRRVNVCYAVKANASLAILQLFARQGCGFDIVSGGELQRVLVAGADASKVIFSGVGKSRTEMRQALQAGIGCFNVESLAELDALDAIARQEGVRAPVSIRVNPDVNPRTHPYISTGLKNNKFGIAHEQVLSTYQHAANLPSLRVVGIDVHIGSQVTEAQPYLEAVDRLLDLVQLIESNGIRLEHIDFGGGLGIDYDGQCVPPSAQDLCKQIFERVDARGFGQRQFMVEPGRSLVGNAGICLTEVLYLKPGEHKNFCIVNAAMNDLPRPALYQAYHRIVPVSVRAGAPGSVYDVVGPVCESGDWLGTDRTLAVQQGDVLAVLSAGAYCMSMSSNYNARSRAAEVLVSGASATPIRQREVIQDQIRMEQMLP